MFERLTERGRQVIVLAQDEARHLKHNYIGSEHVLLGLLREEEGLGARALGNLGVTLEDTRAFVSGVVGQGDEVTTGQIPFTPRAKRSFELALREALSMGHNYVGTEHILLGLVREDEGVAMRFLGERGVTAKLVRDEIIRMLVAGPRKVREETAASRASSDDVTNGKLNEAAVALLEQAIVDSNRGIYKLSRQIQMKEHDLAQYRSDEHYERKRLAELEETLGESYSVTMQQRVLKRES